MKARNIHIHLPPKKPQVAYLMRAKVETKDTKYTGRETKSGGWSVFEQGNPVAVAGPFKTPEECNKWIREHSKTKDGSSEEEREYKQIELKKRELDKKIDQAEDAGKDSEVSRLRAEYAKLAARSDELRTKMKKESSRTEDTNLVELQARRDKLEAEFDKADDAGDNRAMDRIRKELASLDAEIKKQKEQKTRDEKLIKTLSGDKTMVKVYYDDGWKEFQAKLYYKKPFGWQEQNKASYHSDDKEDALSTAADMLRRAEARTKD